MRFRILLVLYLYGFWGTFNWLGILFWLYICSRGSGFRFFNFSIFDLLFLWNEWRFDLGCNFRLEFSAVIWLDRNGWVCKSDIDYYSFLSGMSYLLCGWSIFCLLRFYLRRFLDCFSFDLWHLIIYLRVDLNLKQIPLDFIW